MALIAVAALIESTFFTSRTERYIADEAEGVTQWIIASSAIAATLLSVYGVWLLRNTLKATEQTLQQAFIASRASLDMNEIAKREQRPYIFIESVGSNLREGGEFEAGPRTTTWKFKITNRGKTSAIIEGVYDSLCYSVGFPKLSGKIIGEDGISEPIRFREHFVGNLIIDANRSKYYDTESSTRFDPYLKYTRIPKELEDNAGIKANEVFRASEKQKRLPSFKHGQAYLWLFVKVIYRDAFGEWYESSACFRQGWGSNDKQYEIDGGDQWNFTKRIPRQALPYPSENQTMRVFTPNT